MAAAEALIKADYRPSCSLQGGVRNRYKPVMPVPQPASVPRALLLADLAATARLAGLIAAQSRGADVIGLVGALGCGKTTFARFFLRAMGWRGEEIPSPTFTLVQVYSLPSVEVWHFDLYRLGDPADTVELGFEDALAEGISLIEWPDRLGALLPPERLEVELGMGAAPDERTARLVGYGSWCSRLRLLDDAFAAPA